MAFQHLQNREKRTEDIHKDCFKKTYKSFNLLELHPFNAVLPFYFCTNYSLASVRKLNR